MSNDMATAGRSRRVLPSLVLGLMVAAFLLVSGAQAEEPPVASTGPVGAGGNTASGSVGSSGQTDACLNDQHSEASPSTADPNNPNNAAKVNNGSCQAANGSSATAGSKGSTGSKPGSNARTSGSTAAGVASAQAVGLRIVRVRSVTKRVSVTKRFRVVVTLRDFRGRFVRDAIVSVGRVPGATNTISVMRSTFSNKLGQASIKVPVTKRMLGKRIYLKIAARTPKARSITLRSVRLPALR